MKSTKTDYTSDWTHNWNGSVAIKLTAVILWSVMISAFVLTAPIMLTYEDQKLKEYLWNNQQLINLIETNLVKQTPAPLLKQKLKQVLDSSEIKYISIKSSNYNLSLGIKSENNFQFPVTQIVSRSNQNLTIHIQHERLKRVVTLDRIKLGLSILIGAIIFGFFIYQISQNIVNKPIHRLVELTHKITSGEKNVRFDEDRDDEFGELARFSNNMLDNLESQREELISTNSELISEIRNREEALVASRQKSAFLANMSHEIRTPLSSIIGFSERLRYKNIKSDQEKNEMLDTVLQSSNHLLSLINDILDFSKIEANKLEVTEEEFSIINIVNHTVNLLRNKAMEQSTTIKVVYQFPIPEFINNDATRTKQILLNLCGNALRFTQNGTIIIQVSFDAKNNKIIISVKDTGIGMSKKVMDRLFQPFYQGDKNTSKDFGGTGLGLAISKKLAELMGGDISVKSTKDLGSIFTFRINAGFVSDQILLKNIQTSTVTEQYKKPFENVKFTGKVLLVEDTVEIRNLVQAYMQDYGIEIVTANDGKEGVDIALQEDFDVVIMDIQMPVMNGKEAMKLLQKNNYNKPVIALTADVLLQQISEYKKLGFTKTLAKPIVINDLLLTLNDYLKKKDPDVKLPESIAVEKSANDNTLIQLRERFLNKLLKYIDAIKIANEAGNTETIFTILDEIKDIGGNVGLPEISEKANKISLLLNSNLTVNIDECLNDLEKQINKLNSIV